MSRLNKAITDMFASCNGGELYGRIIKTVEKENMLRFIEKGVLVGFSGGADSVFLISFLREYKRRTNKPFSILAVHVNHGIRGAEAERDENFSGDFLSELGMPFVAVYKDVPALSNECGMGLEETARNVRYSIFEDLIKNRSDIGAIAVAHNATDNTETVLMNILRGSGLSGVCGIKPVRDNIIRPIISISKSEILDILNEYSIPYVVDSTNLSSDYSRNYVRNEILPLLSRLAQSPDTAFSRLTENLRMDLDYLNSQADLIIEREFKEKIDADTLRSLHPSIQAKVISKLVHANTGVYPEEKHITALKELISGNNFRYSLPGEKYFVCERGLCAFLPKKVEKDISRQIFLLNKGENKIHGTNLTVFIGEVDKTSLNVYNFSIQATISSAIIDSGLLLRFKSDGDAYRYSGINHKLKKVFNDRNIPPMQRSRIPIICDGDGIVLLPGMSPRDGAKSDISSDNVPITFAFTTPADGEVELFTALLRR